MSVYNYRNSDDWKMFWIIEENNLEKLKNLCAELINKKKNISVYFNMTETNKIFTQEEIDKINVHVFDVINFSPIQHTCYLNWYDGKNCLSDYKIGMECKYGLTLSRFKKKL